MARTADPQSDSPHTAADGQQRSPQEQREPAAAAVVLTPKGQRRLAARAAWLATGPIPRFATPTSMTLTMAGGPARSTAMTSASWPS